MQLKPLAFTFALIGCVSFTFAQIPSKSARSVDTVSAITPKGALLASNSSPVNVNAYQERLGYAKVPLAGEKSYFGEKNDFISNFVRKYLETNSKTLACVQSNCPKPFEVMDKALEERGMPKELKYLAVIESALNNKAVSHAGAVGPWQLMDGTARMMGLSVNKKVDERTDWGKSTNAALKYLDMLYGDLKDWLLVIAAYNSGPTPVLRAIEKTGSRNFWDIKKYLPQETQGHVLSFIATATIFENLNKFIGLGSLPADTKMTKEKDEEPIPELPMKKVTTSNNTAQTATENKPLFTPEELKNIVIIKIEQPILPELLEKQCGIDRKVTARWNPDYELYVNHKYPSSTYKLRIPKDKLDAFFKNRASMTLLSQMK